jgi:hypothetical protein
MICFSHKIASILSVNYFFQTVSEQFGPLVYQGSVTVVAGLVVLVAYTLHRKGKLNMVHIRSVPY